VVFSFDVTEQVKARQRLNEFNAALEAQVARRTQGVLAAQAEAGAQRTQPHNTFMQAPAMSALVKGPDHVFPLINPLCQQSVGARPLLGRSIREAIPELKGQSPTMCKIVGRTPDQLFGQKLMEVLPEMGDRVEELLDEVLRTGEPYLAHEQPSFLLRDGQRHTMYWNFVYHPLRDHTGHISGIAMVATEVTEHVMARRQLARMNGAWITLSHGLPRSKSAHCQH
jgi:PAS domain S-box-containing protein